MASVLESRQSPAVRRFVTTLLFELTDQRFLSKLAPRPRSRRADPKIYTRFFELGYSSFLTIVWIGSRWSLRRERGRQSPVLFFTNMDYQCFVSVRRRGFEFVCPFSSLSILVEPSGRRSLSRRATLPKLPFPSVKHDHTRGSVVPAAISFFFQCRTREF